MLPNFDALLQLHIDAPAKKLDKSYGTQIAKAIQGQVLGAPNQYFQRRYEKMKSNKAFAKGEQDMNAYKDLFRIQGNQAYVNLDWTPPKIAPKYIEIMLGDFMKYNERPNVTAIDDISLDRKEAEKLNAKYRMQNKQQIQQFQQISGLQLEDPNAFTPEDEDELTVYFDLEFRLPEEILFETDLSKILDDNQYKLLKRKLLRDIIEVNFACTRVWVDPNGAIRIRRCEPEYVIHNMFVSDNGAGDLSYIGEYVSMKITDIRRRYKLDEKVLFTIAQKATNDPKGLKTSVFLESYRWSDTRPYDDYSVLALDFEILNTDSSYHVVKKDAYGNPNVKEKKAKPEIQSDKSELVVDEKQNVYRGIWVCDTDVMLEWGLCKHMIRPYQSINEAFFSFSVIVPNNDGTLIPSIIERATTSIRSMTLIRLKIQQLIAKMRPAGLRVNVAGFNDIDMGNGNTIDIMEAIRIYDQSGNMLYSEDGVDPDQKKTPPISELQNDGNVAQLQELRNQWNYELENLRSETGLNEFRDGTNTTPRMGMAIVQQLQSASNNATSFIYEACMQLWNDTLNKICILHWDNVVLKASEYKQYAGYQMSLLDMTFKASVEMLPTDEDKQKIEELITTAVSAGALDFEQAFRVRQIAHRNYKLANLYLAKMTSRNKKEAQKAAEQNAQMNANAQAQSAQAKAQGEIQKISASGQMELSLEQLRKDKDKETALINYVTQLQLEAFKLGKPIPEDQKQLVDYVIANIIRPMQQEEAADAQQQQQEQMQQMQQDQGGQMPPDEQQEMQDGQQEPEQGEDPEMEQQEAQQPEGQQLM